MHSWGQPCPRPRFADEVCLWQEGPPRADRSCLTLGGAHSLQLGNSALPGTPGEGAHEYPILQLKKPRLGETPSVCLSPSLRLCVSACPPPHTPFVLTLPRFPHLAGGFSITKWATAVQARPASCGDGAPRALRAQLPVQQPRASLRTTQPRPSAPCLPLLPGPAQRRAKPRRAHPLPLPLWSFSGMRRTHPATASPLPPQGVGSATASSSPQTAVIAGVLGFSLFRPPTQVVPKRSPQPEPKAAPHTV